MSGSQSGIVHLPERRLVNMVEVAGSYEATFGWSRCTIEVKMWCALRSIPVLYDRSCKSIIKRKLFDYPYIVVLGSLGRAHAKSGARELYVTGWSPGQYLLPKYASPEDGSRGQLHGRLVELLPRNIVAIDVESTDGGRALSERFELLVSPAQYRELSSPARFGGFVTVDYVLKDVGDRKFEGLPVVRSMAFSDASRPSVSAWH